MSLKINNKNIINAKINSSNISLIKLNGKIIFTLTGNIKLTIEYTNENLTATTDTAGTYDLMYADQNGIINNFEKIITFDLVANTPKSYTYLNLLNTAPPNATRIVAVQNGKIVASDILPTSLKVTFGNKLYSVGLLSDVHIDGKATNDAEDSGLSQKDFRNALTVLKNEGAAFTCIDGDITYYGYLEDYQVYNKIIKEAAGNMPVKATRGNHECYVNGNTTYDNTNTMFQDNVGPYDFEYIHTNGDVYLFLGVYSENTSDPFTSAQMAWLLDKMEKYKNKRVFFFTHFYVEKVGNVNGISGHSPITHPIFRSLISKYKNLIYFSGHTHLAYYLQQYGKNANIEGRSNICMRVHIPSCAKPRISQTGLGETAQVYAEGTEGYLMDVYDDGVYLKGYNFETNKIKPIASYYLNTVPIDVDVPTEKPLTPLLELGGVSTSDGSYYDDPDHVRPKELIYMCGTPEISILTTFDDSIRVVCYDKNKTFITNWYTDGDTGEKYSFQRIKNNGTLKLPDNACYFSFRMTTNVIPKALIAYNGTANPTPDPDPQPDPSGPEYVTTPALELGDISTSNGKPKASNKYSRTSDYVYIKGKPTLRITNNANSKSKVFCYDENKNFITGWLEDAGSFYNYKYVSNGSSFTFPDNVYYVKCRFHATDNATLTISYS